MLVVSKYVCTTQIKYLCSHVWVCKFWLCVCIMCDFMSYDPFVTREIFSCTAVLLIICVLCLYPHLLLRTVQDVLLVVGCCLSVAFFVALILQHIRMKQLLCRELSSKVLGCNVVGTICFFRVVPFNTDNGYKSRRSRNCYSDCIFIIAVSIILAVILFRLLFLFLMTFREFIVVVGMFQFDIVHELSKENLMVQNGQQSEFCVCLLKCLCD